MTRSTLPLVLMLLMFCAQIAGGQEKMAKRRVLYNFDGDSCMFTRAGSKGPVATTVDDIKQLIAEVAFEESQVDTVLVCINAQVMYYPTQAGTLRGTNSTEEEREKWPASEKQRFENMKTFFDAGVDPYAMMLAETRRRGREALLTFRVNDAHGNDFLRTQFWSDHPEWRLGNGALDFSHEEVRDYVFGVIEESVRRYDCDGIELDFNRFPTFFKAGSADERVAKMNSLVERVRKMLNKVGNERGRHLILAARVATNYGRTPPDYKTCREIGCDPAVWATSGWIDFLTVSEFLFERYDLPIKPWKELIHEVPIYGGIECTESGSKEHYLTPAKYRRAARHLWNDGADAIYLFNFFTTREYGAEAWEPPFEVLTELGDRARVAQEPIDLAAEHSAKGIRFVGGEWKLVDGLMQQVSRRDSGQAFFPNRVHKDMMLDFQFYVHPEGDGVRAAGAIIRSADSESFYGVHFDTRNDQVVLYVSPWHDKPDWIVLARNTVALEDSRWYAARVEAIGNKIKVSLNGRALLVTENERYQAGLVGLYTSQGRVDFRDVRIDGTPGELDSAWRDVTPPRRYQIVTSGESAELKIESPDWFACSAPIRELPDQTVYCVYYEEGQHSSIRGMRLKLDASGFAFQYGENPEPD